LKQQGRKDANQVIILLSDGKMDPEPEKGSPYTRALELKNNFLPELKAQSIKIHTLAFSEHADKTLLAEIALGTDGVSWFTPDAEKIHESFADLFLVVKKPQVLPLTSKGFRIDPDIKEATFYINREGEDKVSLLRPNGNEVDAETVSDDIKWYRSNKFDIITVIKPEVGNWQILGLPKNSGYATVITNLRLTTDWPSNVYAGDSTTLQARMYDNEKAIQLPTMTDQIRYAFQVTPTDKISEPILREKLFDDGKHGDVVARDGIFSGKVKIEEPGEYKLKIVASAPTFERYLHIPFRVKPRMVSVEVVAVEDNGSGHGASHGDEHGGETESHGGDDEHSSASHGSSHGSGHGTSQDYFRVSLSTEVVKLKKVQVNLVAIDEKNKPYRIPLNKAGDTLRYEAPTSILPHDGKYVLQATMEAEGKKKQRVKAKSLSIEYSKHTAKIDESKEEIVTLVQEPTGPPPPESPLIYIILVTLINIAAGGFGIMQITKVQSNVDTGGAVEFTDIQPYHAALNALTDKLASSEVDLNDPIFSPENLDKAKEVLGNVDASAIPTESSSGDSSEAEEENKESASSEDGEAENSTEAEADESSGEAEEDSTEDEASSEEADEEAGEAEAEAQEEEEEES
ncbi:MAG: VWA domain-containing protein, partial [Bdellovibrionales bacterium]|nr:VWA domain-containing protein [Bdellovibrionales bacterium]